MEIIVQQQSNIKVAQCVNSKCNVHVHICDDTKIKTM